MGCRENPPRADSNYRNPFQSSRSIAVHNLSDAEWRKYVKARLARAMGEVPRPDDRPEWKRNDDVRKLKEREKRFAEHVARGGAFGTIYKNGIPVDFELISGDEF